MRDSSLGKMKLRDEKKTLPLEMCLSCMSYRIIEMSSGNESTYLKIQLQVRSMVIGFYFIYLSIQ